MHARASADSEHRRPRLIRGRVTALAEVVEEDDRPPGRVDLFAVDGERRVAADDDVHLLVDELGVILDDFVASAAGCVRVDANRRYPALISHRLTYALV